MSKNKSVCIKLMSALQNSTTNLLNHLKEENKLHTNECAKAKKNNVANVTLLNPRPYPASTLTCRTEMLYITVRGSESSSAALSYFETKICTLVK